IALPLVANQERIGCLVFLTRDEHDFAAEETDFLSTLAGQAAIAIHHAELYDRSQLQAEELRGAHKVKDDFLRVVSNQLKSPLSVITGYADMFLDGLLGEITPLQEKAIETMARQSRELHGLINTILQVSNMESETPHVEIHEVNLWEFLTDVRSMYDEPLAKDVKLLWDYPSDLPLVRADRGKLRHIIENLVNNAIKFTEQGAVTITARYLSAKEILELKVADTGVGIAKGRLSTIFERFRQAQDLSVGTPRGGVGLGLYIVKTYTDLLGGKIHVESRPGEGSIFTLQIPAPLKGSHTPHEQLLLPTELEAPGNAAR
ncbi:MAG: ATP-binding protein, partial [Chloroflexota bacterium]